MTNQIYSLMKHLKKFEAKSDNLLSIDELDGTMMDIFCGLTDEGFSLEVLHQNGYASYVIMPPIDIYQHSNLIRNLTDDSNNNLKTDYKWEAIEENLTAHINILSLVNSELNDIRGRVMNIPGVKEFQLTQRASININVNHKPQGFGGLGPVMLIGDKSKSVYSDHN